MSSDLFEFAENNSRDESISRPLAHRMRPRTLNEVAGQRHILGSGKPLRQWVEADRVPSLVFWGPPGCGKTTLAQMIAQYTKSEFFSLSAVISGVKDIKEVIEKAQMLRSNYRRKTLLFVDEIHRFNRGQQEALLPHVERGTLTLIGATTENPSFELTSALLSRLRVLRLEPLTSEDLVGVLERALTDTERGLGGFVRMTEEAIQWIARISEGDARRALTSLEGIALFMGAELNSVGAAEIDLKQVQAILEKQPIVYDKNGDEHYNVISAFIKSIRDSDPHAGLYYLARMLEGGEDPLFIARRLVILASEDVGNADPRGIMVAIAAKEAVDFIGMPEARISLAQAVTYLALAPKSNASYEGMNQAIAEVRQSGALAVPPHLKNAVTGLMKAQGYGQGYRYAHSQQNARAKQTHLPSSLIKRRFYFPKEVGAEVAFKKRLDELNSDFDGET